MPRPFAAFVSAETVALPLLPAAHTMDGLRFRMTTTAFAIDLDPTPCSVYNECLSYLYYGRPAYRGHDKNKGVSLSSLYLVSFIFDIASLPPLTRLMPFDSGAFHNEMFKNSMHPKMILQDFELPPTIATAGQVVKKFFGSNAAYWRGRARNDLGPFGFNFEAECYTQLISGEGGTEYDDRRSAIEMQVQQKIDFSQTRVLAIIAPECLADAAGVDDFVSKSGAELLTYECYHARQIEDTRAIVDRTYQFLSKRGMI